LEDPILKNSGRIIIPVQPSQQLIERTTSKPLLKNFKSWLKVFLEPSISTAIFTAVIAFCTAVYTYMMWDYTKATYGLLEAAQKANSNAQKIFYEQHRPYVFISGVSSGKKDEKKKYLEFLFSIKNSGGTPAYNIEINILIGQPYFTNFSMKHNHRDFHATVFPQTEIITEVYLDDNLYDYIRENDAQINMGIEINYTSIANEQHYTKEFVRLSNRENVINVMTEVIESN
jgi:hypothetical protein